MPVIAPALRVAPRVIPAAATPAPAEVPSVSTDVQPPRSAARQSTAVTTPERSRAIMLTDPLAHCQHLASSTLCSNVRSTLRLHDPSNFRRFPTNYDNNPGSPDHFDRAVFGSI